MDTYNMNETYHLKPYSLRQLSNLGHRMCIYYSTHDLDVRIWSQKVVCTPPGPHTGRASVSDTRSLILQKEILD